MKRKENLSMLTHSHPNWLLKNPTLLSPFHSLHYLFQLRKWYITKHLSKLLKSLPNTFKFIDLGCGEGQFLFQFAPLHPNAHFLGVDKIESNVQLCRSYIKAKNLKGVQVVHSDIESMNLENAYDVAICIGVFQYIPDDKKAMECIYKALVPGGRFFLYTPINNRIILPFYKKIQDSFPSYETVQGMKRIYSEEMVQNLGKNAGFSVQERIITYGFWGNLGHEINSLCFLFIAQWIFPLNIFAVLLYVLLYPFILLCMLLDFIIPAQKGNGILLVLRKDD